MLGVAEHSLFETVDLFEGKDLGLVVRCIFALGSTAQLTCPAFPGPHLGAKLSQVRKKEPTMLDSHPASIISPQESKWVENAAVDARPPFPRARSCSCLCLRPIPLTDQQAYLQRRAEVQGSGKLLLHPDGHGISPFHGAHPGVHEVRLARGSMTNVRTFNQQKHNK